MAGRRFEIVSDVIDVETIAVGRGVRELARLRKRYGPGRWRKMKGVATIRLAGGRVRRVCQRAIMVRSSRTRFAVCIHNSGYPASLELHKIYRVLPDKEAEADGDLRIVDESGEDYLYEADRFLPVDLPAKTVRALNRSFARFEAEAR